MAKQGKFVFVCQGCGYQTAKWMGRCTECGQWNSFVEERSEPAVRTGRATSTGHPRRIDAISLDPKLRFKTGINEFDRTLGGGLVPGSLVLIGGDPGIGKSTLLLRVMGRFAGDGLKTLYLSGEESPQQIKIRADRLAIHSEDLYVLAGTCRVASVKAASSGGNSSSGP